MKIKDLSKKIEAGKTTLAVVNESGNVVDVMVLNGDIDQVLLVEKWFDYSKLADDEYLYRFYRFVRLFDTPQVYGVDSQEIETTNWHLIEG